MHILRHCIEGMFGPVYCTWMNPYERFNSWISRRELKRSPEIGIMETYRVRVGLTITCLYSNVLYIYLRTCNIFVITCYIYTRICVIL